MSFVKSEERSLYSLFAAAVQMLNLRMKCIYLFFYFVFWIGRVGVSASRAKFPVALSSHIVFMP